MLRKSLITGLLIVISTVANATSGGEDKPLHPKDSNAEYAKYVQQIIGVEIPVPQFEIDFEAEKTDLGKLSKSLLGQFYTHIQSIDYKSDKALVKARVGNMSCDMEFTSLQFAGDEKPSWKLQKLNCL